MAISEAEFWMQIDREGLLAECASMSSGDGGLLVAVGDDSSGRNEAARIAASFFVKAGLQAHHVLDAGDRPSSFRYVLENIADWALAKLGHPGPALSMRASNVSISVEMMFDYCVRTLQKLQESNSSPPLAFIISAFERNMSFTSADVRNMAKLKESVGGCWVVLSEKGELWKKVFHNVMKLDDFTRPDVENALRRVIRKNGGDLSHVSDYLDRLFKPGVRSVRPSRAYYHVQLASAAPDGYYWNL
jgi:hypothetical protein